MGRVTVDKISCRYCGAIRAEGDLGPCPKCGRKGRRINESVEDGINFSGSLGWKHAREYYKKNKAAQFIVLSITFGSPFVGLFLAGVPGVILGLVFGILSYFLGARAIIKVREITRGGNL